MPVSFNLSHSGLHGLIAVERAGRIGMDVEVRRPRPDLLGTVRTIMTPLEARTLSRFPKSEKDHRLYRIWTLKEAIAKVLGMGFSLDLTGFSIPAAMLDGMRTCEFRSVFHTIPPSGGDRKTWATPFTLLRWCWNSLRTLWDVLDSPLPAPGSFPTAQEETVTEPEPKPECPADGRSANSPCP